MLSNNIGYCEIFNVNIVYVEYMVSPKTEDLLICKIFCSLHEITVCTHFMNI